MGAMGAMLEVSERAEAAIRQVVDTADEDANGLRIMVQTGGCAGVRYLLGLENESMSGDMIVTCGSVVIYVDEDSIPWLTGTRIDFVDSNDGSGFVFANPNAGPCVCGSPLSC